MTELADRPRAHVQPVNDPFDQRWYGVYPALVVDNQDPQGQGRVKVRLPWADASTYEVWARLATAMAGASRGTWFVPDTDDEVLVSFAFGSVDHPYVVGALWNGQDDPPVSMGADNNVKAIVSRNDIRVTLDDQTGQETFEVTTPGGTKLRLQDGPSTIRMEDANGNSVELGPSGITITASAKVSISASQVDVSAGMVKVDAGMSTFSGVVKSDTNITNATISASYTPGAGNVW